MVKKTKSSMDDGLVVYDDDGHASNCCKTFQKSPMDSAVQLLAKLADLPAVSRGTRTLMIAGNTTSVLRESLENMVVRSALSLRLEILMEAELARTQKMFPDGECLLMWNNLLRQRSVL